jgi:hypothetical protein
MWKRQSRLGTLFGFLFVSFAAHSAVMIETTFEAQPQLQLKDGKPRSCGLRVFTVRPTPASGVFTGIDGSFLVDSSAYGLVKGIVYTIKKGNIEASTRPAPQPLKLIWFRAPGKSATQPLGEKAFVSPETKGAKLYVTAPVPVFDLFAAILDSKPIQVGVSFESGTDDRIYYGKVSLSEADAAQLKECLSEMMDSLPKE